MPTHKDLEDIAVDFPRPQRGGSSQHLLVTMLSEFWRDTEAYLPTAVITGLAEDCGLTRTSAGPGLSRLKQRGVLESSGAGKSTAYRFSAAARHRMAIGAQQVLAFGAAQQPWDRQWTMVAFTVPEEERPRREALRARLGWLGFAPMYGALWVAAGDRTEETSQLCSDFGVNDFFCAAVDDASVAGRSPLTAWNLSAPPASLVDFLRNFEAPSGNLEGLTAAEAFSLRVAATDQWRTFPWDAPPFPPELLPADWPLERAHEVFVAIQEGTRAATTAHVGQRIGGTEPALVAEVLVHGGAGRP